ncbi:hypothetical protein LTR99_008647 [Exophiala xenobiotica]|uniref:Xylanolytic transcriptional activator regulatory domain-containing protein n=1 Tax=Vermiconidia calcicola TaxID=1690605 RepID=A0AAV9Q1X6_9PEZI|nr:hypothetical protein LTR99_008647 [Exophiala xenobiotica]KAK5533036.1 hypothetical protein LTR25_007741 [Vermiconidia calcicola]KAK5534367.1 hypothetical protein LTR23_008796 [Chaetothyriales sp. CCFEE 6169]KAK5459334.1 hypothetical protein LTR20_008006 [Exophiala xenobiotica]KAK5509677.1 hypothetical protein LTR21_007868 [Exophiala xenobiotica]
MISLSALYIDPRTCESVGFDASNVRDSGHFWFRLSRQALHAGEYESRPCLTQLQVFIESQLYWYATKAVESLNSFQASTNEFSALGQAIRCAQAIGLDKDRTPATDLASELRHRLWWDLCCSDTFQSLCLDRQTLVQSHLSEVPMPQNCDDSDITWYTINIRPIEEPTAMSMHVLRAHLFKTFNKLYANNGAALASYEEVSSIDTEIIAIVNQFPWYFKSAPGNAIVSPTFPPAYDYIQWQHHLIHNSICVQRIRMYRPFLRTSYHNACWSKCIEAVEEAFAVYHAIRAANPSRFQRSQRMLAQSYQIFCSAVSIAVFLLVERPVVPSRMQADIEVVIQDLQKLVQNHSSIPMAVAGRDVLTKILHAYNNGDGLHAQHDVHDGAPSSNWHSLIPEIYAYMGGKTKTKTYLERCTVSHIMNQESGVTAAQARPVTHSQTGTTATPPDAAQATQGSIEMVYSTSADATIANDPVPSFGFDLHFDVLNWGAEDFPFLQ